MDRTFAERRVYNGAQVKRGYRVTSIEVCQEPLGTIPVETVAVRDRDEYSSGCKVHPRCLGHMCITPNGNLLPFHTLSLASGEIVTEYLAASAKAFQGDEAEYKRSLEVTNKGKHGHLRSIMRTPVSGSARLVVTPHVEGDKRCIYISDHLASKITFCDVPIDENGVRSTTFVERSLKEDDTVILERPPSLTIWNNQPLRVRHWKRETLGVHPEIFTQLGGDYDGDEAHIFPIGTPEALEEARKWIYTPFSKFEVARGIFDRATGSGVVKGSTGKALEFLEHTTLSAAQIRSGDYHLALGDETRNKNDFVMMLGENLRSSTAHHSFVRDSIQGVKDVMRQQLGQGSIGHLTRIAKIAMMCFYRSSAGGTYVAGSRGNALLLCDTLPSRGTPSVRATLSLCGVAQQSRLNAHKVGEFSSTSFDLVTDLFLGRSSAGESKELQALPVDTLYIFSGDTEETLIRLMNPTWVYRRSADYVVLASDSCADRMPQGCIGAYSPVVLAAIGLTYTETVEVCLRALNFVFAYNDVGVEADDLRDMAAGFAYQVERSVFPITCSAGLSKRDVGWVEKSMGTDMRELGRVSGKRVEPSTSTSAAFMSNFGILS